MVIHNAVMYVHKVFIDINKFSRIPAIHNEINMDIHD